MLRAIVFDFDGIIVDAEPVHLRAFQDALAESNIFLSEGEYYDRYLALDDRSLFLALLKDRNLNLDPSSIGYLVQKKSDSYEKLIREGIKIFPGVVDFVNSVSLRYPLGIGSGALRHEIEFILNHIGIRDRFCVIVSAEDVERCKPAPDVFLKVLFEINETLPRGSEPIYPSECLVIEDSSAGISAAKDAGMRTLAITNSYTSSKLSEADLIEDTLVDVDIRELEDLFNVR